MSRNAIIALAAAVLVVVVGSWFFRKSADVDIGNTPASRQEVPAGEGTRGIPAERQTP